jgi:hypothetical protein
MEFIRGKHQKKAINLSVPDLQPGKEDLPQGYEILPDYLHNQPALKDRKHMKGVAIPIDKDDSDSEDLADNAAVASQGAHEDDIEVLSGGEDSRYMTRSRFVIRTKSSKIPAHLAMPESEGSDSDPDIKAPGWNLPLERMGYRRKADELSSDEDSSPETKKKTKSKKAGSKKTAQSKDVLEAQNRVANDKTSGRKTVRGTKATKSRS